MTARRVSSSLRLFQKLLSAGQSGDFASIAQLTGAGEFDRVVGFSYDIRRSEIWGKFEALSDEDKIALAKAIAAYEHTVGGIGSPTSLDPILQRINETFVEGHEGFVEVVDWIYANGMGHTLAGSGYGRS